MDWRSRQLFGGVLLAQLVSVHLAHSFTNDTITTGIPEVFANASRGNALWESLLQNCKNPTFTCIQNSMYEYLDNVLDSTNEYEVGGFIEFVRNNASYDEYQHNNEIDDDPQGKFTSHLEEVTSTLQGKATKFMMTHNVRVQMPEMLFEGTTLQISPRQLEEDGLVARLEFLPKVNNEATPRIFKKIKKFIGEKLMNALLAIMLVISLLATKFMFFLPMVMGVAAAKKLLLKLLLFFFPFLAHIFKLCPYYHPHTGTKFHHHHHQIAHLHHVPPPHILKHPPIIHDDHPHIIEDYPPGHDEHSHYDGGLDYYSEGPHFTHEFITHRKDLKNGLGGSEEASSWSGGQGQDALKRVRKPQMNRPLTPKEIENLVLKAEKEAVLKVRLQQEHQRVLAENKLLQEQIKQGLKIQEKLRLQSALMQQKKRLEAMQPPQVVPPRAASKISEPSQHLKTPPIVPTFPMKAPHLNKVVSLQNSLNQAPVNPKATQASNVALQIPLSNKAVQVKVPPGPQPAAPADQTEKPMFSQPLVQTQAAAQDPFYSPILDKIDKILMGIGFTEEPCRERLICSMYKNPQKFSPYSNLVSAQLSRDASELQKPTATNTAVIRFYRYVQAARDGQDKRECLRLYPSCSINTEL